MLPVVCLTWPAGYGFRPFRVGTTEVDFHYSRRAADTDQNGCKGSNICAVWTPRHQETLINGVLQGRKQTDGLGASALSRFQIRDLLAETIGLVDVPGLKNVLEMCSYLDMKSSQELEHRRRVKEDVTRKALKGWNNGSAGSSLAELL